MTVLEGFHEDHGATFTERGGRRVVGNYGRPTQAHKAVRNVVGVIEMGYGVVLVEGADRVEFVDNAISNTVPTEDGQGVYALLLDPQGRVELDMYVYNAGERLLLFTPPDEAAPLAEDWRGKTFIQDVDISVATDDFAVFGVHGPKATEKVASVLTGPGAPEGALSFDRGSMGDAGVTVIATDALTGEEGYEVVCAADKAEEVLDALLYFGMAATPFGYDTWDSLTLEAGTPLFETELEGRIPNVAGIRNALNFDKGCFVGQEVVSRVENRGQPSRRLVGLVCEEVPEAGANVTANGDDVGEVTRAVQSPLRDEPIALAYVEYGLDATDVTVGETTGSIEPLPFVEGSQQSERLPTYPN
ncbi:aminomethyltransferase family protein [Haladaptatus sp. DYSN1]|uniref:CAF17-like 4Fe-4S cluster assembly/insertion protein YgfZ n=1 Tax=unclassified Haladaptatus TaxID=2622732 RepID=UPI0024055166|nr:aminomethyltransferase family protein [Haladaptatus sp. DYSN1]